LREARGAPAHWKRMDPHAQPPEKGTVMPQSSRGWAAEDHGGA
jgi:hypothetical protein